MWDPLLLFATATAFVAAAMRWAALPPMLPDLDAVNFARALQRFDLVAQAPHFPGYPVYVAMARLVAQAGAADVLALAFPGLALSAAAAVALAIALRRLLAPAGLVAATTLWAFLPMPVLFGATPSSDGAGVALLVLAIAAALAIPGPIDDTSVLASEPPKPKAKVGSTLEPSSARSGPSLELSYATVGSGPVLSSASAGSSLELSGSGAGSSLEPSSAGTGSSLEPSSAGTGPSLEPRDAPVSSGPELSSARVGSGLELGSTRWRALAGGVIGALALGARPSYLVAVGALVMVVRRESRALWILGAVFGCASWLAPMALLTGPATLWRVATAFVRGHAGEWGGTVAVRPNLLDRIDWFAFDVGAAGLGTPAGAGESANPARWIVASAILLLLAAVGYASVKSRLTSGEQRVVLAALWIGAPYAVCMFFGQNLLKSRHALPIVVAIALLAAVGASWLWRQRPVASWSLVSILAIALAGVTLPLAQEQSSSPSPAAQLVRHVDRTLPAAGTVLFTGEEARLFEYYAPYFRAGRPGSAAQLEREVALVSSAGAAVYVTSAAPGVDRLQARLVPVARFQCSRLVRSHAHALVLYRFAPDRARGPETVL